VWSVRLPQWAVITSLSSLHCRRVPLTPTDECDTSRFLHVDWTRATLNLRGWLQSTARGSCVQSQTPQYPPPEAESSSWSSAPVTAPQAERPADTPSGLRGSVESALACASFVSTQQVPRPIPSSNSKQSLPRASLFASRQHAASSTSRAPPIPSPYNCQVPHRMVSHFPNFSSFSPTFLHCPQQFRHWLSPPRACTVMNARDVCHTHFSFRRSAAVMFASTTACCRSRMSVPANRDSVCRHSRLSE